MLSGLFRLTCSKSSIRPRLISKSYARKTFLLAIDLTPLFAPPRTEREFADRTYKAIGHKTALARRASFLKPHCVYTMRQFRRKKCLASSLLYWRRDPSLLWHNILAPFVSGF